jgi:hypothetical protein
MELIEVRQIPFKLKTMFLLPEVWINIVRVYTSLRIIDHSVVYSEFARL